MHLFLLETIALVGATVHTLEPGVPPLEGATVVIEDDRITAVGVDVALPEGAEIVDVAGLHLMPGLIDAVIAFDAEHDVLYLDAGVTLVHDSGSPTGEMVMESTREMRDRHPGPRLLVTTPVLAGAGTQRPGAFVLLEPERASGQLDELLALIDRAQAPLASLSVDRSLNPAQHALVAGTARDRGLALFGGLPVGVNPRQAGAQGHSVVVGLESFLPPGQRFETLKEPFGFEALAREVKASGLAVAPLLGGTARILAGIELDGDPPVLEALGPVYETTWRADMEMFAVLSEGNTQELARTSLARQGALVAALHAAGVPLVAGSGAATTLIAPGAGLVDELQLWADAGVPLPDILRAATRVTAATVGEGAREGQVAPGYNANLLVLGSDPTRSLAALRSPELVVLRGDLHERFELDERRAKLVERQREARAARRAPIALERPAMPEGELLHEGTLDLYNYGDRTATERYAVVRLADGAMAYGARIRVLPTGKQDALEMVLVQTLRGSQVESFRMTLDALDDDGAPKLGENDSHAFEARGARGPESQRIGVERWRFGQSLGTSRAAESIALIEGSSAASGLIAALHGEPGIGYSIEFDEALMTPVVDRFDLQPPAEDGRVVVADGRGVRVWGFGPAGELLFGVRAENSGRLVFEPGPAPEGAPQQLEMPKERIFTGDPKNPFAATGPVAAPAEAGSGK